MVVLIVALLSLATSGPDAASNAASGKRNDETRICKESERVAGSRVNKRRRCMAAADWAREQEQARRYFGRGSLGAN